MNNDKLIYSILFELTNGRVPNHTDYKLELFIWAETLERMGNYGYVRGVTISYFEEDEWYDETVHSVVLDSVQVTNVGLAFLKENSSWMQTYKEIANVNEWLEI
ncbi:YjcQ family protein [Solibacillus cecembensis]|uniref:YjcQ family protein n=1 Tax=Solibacillus cecembensis TaxID=459347 RepID=UPI003A9AF5A4